MLYVILNSFLTVSVSDYGAELQSIQGANGTEYLWQGDPTYWKDRAINLFPYVARLTDNAIAVYEDTRGHVESKCKKCGRITVFDVLNMRRLRPRTK